MSQQFPTLLLLLGAKGTSGCVGWKEWFRDEEREVELGRLMGLANQVMQCEDNTKARESSRRLLYLVSLVLYFH